MIPNSVPVYLASQAADMRKGVEGLRRLVRGSLQMNPMTEARFVFYGKRKNIVKVLWCGGNGFVIYYKKLERGSFPIPSIAPWQSHVTLSTQDLAMLLDGVELATVQRRPHWRAPRDLS